MGIFMKYKPGVALADTVDTCFTAVLAEERAVPEELLKNHPGCRTDGCGAYQVPDTGNIFTGLVFFAVFRNHQGFS